MGVRIAVAVTILLGITALTPLRGVFVDYFAEEPATETNITATTTPIVVERVVERIVAVPVFREVVVEVPVVETSPVVTTTTPEPTLEIVGGRAVVRFGEAAYNVVTLYWETSEPTYGKAFITSKGESFTLESPSGFSTVHSVSLHIPTDSVVNYIVESVSSTKSVKRTGAFIATNRASYDLY